MLPYPLGIVEKLAISTGSRILLVVLDGVGDVAAGGMTRSPRRRRRISTTWLAAARSGCRPSVAPGIAPGSGPGHLSLFGYDPIVYEVGRGVLSALGLGLDLGPDEVAARGNFATVDAAGRIVDRRAGRISTELNRTLIAALAAAIREIDGVSIDLHTEAEYRFVVRLRGEGLGGEVADTDPGRVGEPPLEPRPIDDGEAERRTARVMQRFVERARQVLADLPAAREAKPPVNAVLLRGVGLTPRLPQLPAITRMRPAAIAAYPMYRGVARLVGMECVPMDVSGEGERTEAKLAAYDAHAAAHDFLYFHVKKIDSAGKDGNFAKKVAEIEAFDAIVPRLLAAAPDVVVVTGDHSTPVALKAHLVASVAGADLEPRRAPGRSPLHRSRVPRRQSRHHAPPRSPAAGDGERGKLRSTGRERHAMDLRLDHHVALVSGGGTGIGEAIARAFARSGAAVAISGRRREVIEAAAAAMASEAGGRVIAIAGDVSKRADCERMVAETVARFGRLDVLVNNAGVSRGGPLGSMPKRRFTKSSTSISKDPSS